MSAAVEQLAAGAITLHQAGQLADAIICYRKIVALAPDHGDAHNNLGVAYQQQGLFDAAAACHVRAIACKPTDAQLHLNLGLALEHSGQFDAAMRCFERAIDLNPRYADAHNNVGVRLQGRRRMDAAVAAFRTAIAIQPDHAQAHFNLATALLSEGIWAEGWMEHEWRWKTAHLSSDRRTFAEPQWRGEAAGGRTLLIHAEQGFGDTLQFCRYATLAADRGMRVIMEVPGPLVRLLRSLAGVSLVLARGDALPPFDLHCPMLSLPAAFGTDLASIPRPGSYLQADAVMVASWHGRLAMLASPHPRVGLVRAGNARMHLPALAAVDRRRSIASDRFAPLLAVSGVTFFNLQKDGSIVSEGGGLNDFMAEVADFADTAALIANLDLVISVDTAVAHVAAALGKPVWLLDRFDSCWRWLNGRRDSPWYPALRIYRQPRPGDWDAVLAEVVDDLRALAVGSRRRNVISI